MMGLIVKDSGINGRGVHTDAPIAKDAVVIEWKLSSPLSENELVALSPEEGRYLETIDGKTYVVGIPERYVNHSCDANTHPQGTNDIASRDIATGEEITADYRLFNSDHDFECRCGAANCAGRIITHKRP